jgi:hypothetical protein
LSGSVEAVRKLLAVKFFAPENPVCSGERIEKRELFSRLAWLFSPLLFPATMVEEKELIKSS